MDSLSPAIWIGSPIAAACSGGLRRECTPTAAKRPVFATVDRPPRATELAACDGKIPSNVLGREACLRGARDQAFPARGASRRVRRRCGRCRDCGRRSPSTTRLPLEMPGARPGHDLIRGGGRRDRFDGSRAHAHDLPESVAEWVGPTMAGYKATCSPTSSFSTTNIFSAYSSNTCRLHNKKTHLGRDAPLARPAEQRPAVAPFEGSCFFTITMRVLFRRRWGARQLPRTTVEHGDFDCAATSCWGVSTSSAPLRAFAPVGAITSGARRCATTPSRSSV